MCVSMYSPERFLELPKMGDRCSTLGVRSLMFYFGLLPLLHPRHVRLMNSSILDSEVTKPTQ